MKILHLTSILLGIGLVLSGCGGSGSGAAITTPAHIYVGDAGNGRIIRMDDMNGTGWTVKTGAEGGGTAFGTVSLDFAVDSLGRIYVADAGNNRIVRYDSFTSTTATSFGTQGTGVNQLHWPIGIAIDSADRIYVADYQKPDRQDQRHDWSQLDHVWCQRRGDKPIQRTSWHRPGQSKPDICG